MKKLVAMVMTAAMVASLVPATAFAKGDESATAKIVDAKDFTKNDAQAANGKIYLGEEGPELRLTMTQVEAQLTTGGDFPDFTVELTLDNAEWESVDADDLKDLVSANLDGTKTPQGSTAYNPATPGAPATAFVEVGSVANSSTLTSIPNTWKNADGIATDNTGTNFTTWDDLKATINKTTAEKVQAKLDEGWTLAPAQSLDDLATSPKKDSDGDIYLEKSGRTAIKIYDNTLNSGAGDFVTAYQADTSGNADLLAAVKAVDTTGSGPLYAMNKTTTATGSTAGTNTDSYFVEVVDFDTDYVKYKIRYNPEDVAKDDYFIFDLKAVFTKLSVGTKATVSVEGVADADDLVFASIESRGISASIKKLANVAEEEKNTLEKDLVIKSTVGDFAPGQVIELKLSKGFEFVKNGWTDGTGYTWQNVDGNYAEIKLANDFAGDEVTIKATECTIEATSAKAGATAVMTVKAVKTAGDDATFSDSTTVEVMKVVEYTVILSVDEDKEVPVIYSGVNVDNYGITDDSDHLSLEVTAEETFPGAWSFRKGFNFELPAGVYVTDVNVIEHEGFLVTQTTADATAAPVEDDEMMEAFFNAYQEGDHVNFEFEKRVFDDVDAKLNDKEAKVTFELELVADPGFVGDVTLKLTGDLVDTQEVVIAKFVAPYTVVAEQNDMKIDYRYTDIPTEIKITEAEAGLWAKKEAAFQFYLDKEDYIEFEDDPVFTIDADSNLKIKDEGKTRGNRINFTIDTESDEPATVTISGMSLFMQRSIPAGPYDLKIATTLADEYEQQVLFAPDCIDSYSDTAACDCGYDDDYTCEDDEDCFVADVCDYSEVAKAAFVNIVTAGREQDDASFTTKVVVPVGEKYIVAGEKQQEIDVPAYLNAAGYTMLPVRAVATALGINNNNVLWDQATKTVTILYGQRIITMQVGAQVVYVNGAAIPASSSVEITDSRTFLGLRDLANALGVKNIAWDPATKTATLNGEEVKTAE